MSNKMMFNFQTIFITEFLTMVIQAFFYFIRLKIISRAVHNMHLISPNIPQFMLQKNVDYYKSNLFFYLFFVNIFLMRINYAMN
jgi:hypothetical protein